MLFALRDTLAEAHANRATAAEGNVKGSLADPEGAQELGVIGEAVARFSIVRGDLQGAKRGRAVEDPAARQDHDHQVHQAE